MSGVSLKSRSSRRRAAGSAIGRALFARSWPLLLLLLLLLSPAGRVVAQTTRPDSATPIRTLSDLLADASRRNVLPRELLSYSSAVETELSIILRREEGTEVVAAVEQVASNVRWTRAGQFEQHVVGYRAQQTSPTVSMLSAFQTGWLTASLYGNRVSVRTRGSGAVATGVPVDSSRGRGAARARRPVRQDGADTLPAVHPLATDRERYYTYSGGDTIVRINVGGRIIPIAQVRVIPTREQASPVLLFDGEIDLDASRGTLVRMRGTFVRVGGSRPRGMAGMIDAVAFVEYENGERLGAYWLPAKQRVELQIAAPAIGEGRVVVRIASRFHEMMVNDTVLSDATLAIADSLRANGRRRLTYAAGDSIERFGAWRAGLGVLSDGMHADDFLDVAPDRWRPYGLPRFDWVVQRPADLFHFNRVEGVYTGMGAKLALRDVAPGVVVRANAGWAWNEGTARGRLSVERKRGPWLLELRGGRAMDNTNDFRVPFDSGNSLGALIASQDPYDYVSRSSATIAAVRTIGARAWIVRTEFGVADDRYRPAVYARSPFGGSAYRPNRGVDEGSYLRTASLVEWHPDISAEFAKPGLSARFFYERGDGTLDFQRMEARLVGRLPMGPFVAIARGDVGTVLGDRPPSQQLFELGKQQNLPGYADKEFAGTRAAILRATMQYTSPFLRRPIRWGQVFLPAVAPGLSVGVQSGWTEAPNAAARAAIDRLAITDPRSLILVAPVSRPSDGIRASVTAGLRLFSGGVFIGATRPVDQAAKWRALFTFGQQW